MAEPRRRGPFSGATLGAAVAVGVILAAAAMVSPIRQWHRTLTRPATASAIVATDPAVRREAWALLEADLRDDQSRDETLAAIDLAIQDALRDGVLPEAAIAELALRRDRFSAWRWDREPDRAVIERAIEVAADASTAPADPALVALAAQRLLDFPNHAAWPVAPSSIAAIWNRLDVPMQARLLPRIASIDSRSRRETLALLEAPADPRLSAGVMLARLEADGDSDAALAVAHNRVHESGSRDRAAAAAVRLAPLAAIGLLARIDEDPEAPWATILAPAADDPAVRAAIESRAASGDPAARRLLARIDAIADGEPPEVESLAAAWDLLSDPSALLDRRRLAALVLLAESATEELPESAIANLLDGPIADEGGSVLAAALLAEATGRTRSASRWLRSLEDDRKRAGAILAVLSDGRGGADAAAIARTQSAASDPQVRSVLRAAAWALASPRDFGKREADRAFVHRISHQDDRGTLDLDVLALRLAAGDAEAVETLLEVPDPPERDDAEAIERWSERLAWRWVLVERFVPSLAETLGPPLGGSRRERSLQRDLARASWWALRSQLRFDPASRRWVRRPTASSDELGAGRPSAALDHRLDL